MTLPSLEMKYLEEIKKLREHQELNCPELLLFSSTGALVTTTASPTTLWSPGRRLSQLYKIHGNHDKPQVCLPVL